MTTKFKVGDRVRCENLRSDVQEVLARADRAEKERDEARALCASIRDALSSVLDLDRSEPEVGLFPVTDKELPEVIKNREESLSRHLNELIAERDRAIAERDEAREAWGRAESDACEWEEKAGVASADLATFTEKLHKAIAERDEALKRNRLGLSAYETVGDCSDWVEAVATGIGIYYEYDGPFVAAEARHVVDTIKRERAEHERLLLDAYLARDNAEAERDDLGCQLEALRAVQRGDVADLRTRMEAVEGRIDTIVGIKMARNDDEKGGA
jgi:hypothetical protein